MLRFYFCTTLILSVFLLAGGVAALYWRHTLFSSIHAEKERAESSLLFTMEHVQDEVVRYFQVTSVLAKSTDILAHLNGKDRSQALTKIFTDIIEETDIYQIELLDDQNHLRIQASKGTFYVIDRPSIHNNSPHFSYSALGPERTFSYAQPIRDSKNKPLGQIIITSHVKDLEKDFDKGRIIYFTDPFGIILLSNYPEFHYMRQAPILPEEQKILERYYKLDTIKPSLEHRHVDLAGLDIIIRTKPNDYLPKAGIHLSKDIPYTNLKLNTVADIHSVQYIALMRAVTLSAICMFLGIILIYFIERHHNIQRQLDNEEKMKHDLEKRVQESVRHLSSVNRNLRQEIKDHKITETALKRAQSELMLAGKMSALGQLSANIGHEINQPLMAITSFSENARLYLEKGEIRKAQDNLSKIVDLCAHIGRAIKNIRSLSQQKREPLSELHIIDIIRDILDLNKIRLEKAHIQLVYHFPKEPVMVLAGEVRVRQIIFNILSNAIESMKKTPQKILTISIRHNSFIWVSFHDTGDGIKEPQKVFDPFYTTKDDSHPSGMGLGLSISQELARSFGGEISCCNPSKGGAEFTLKMNRSDIQE